MFTMHFFFFILFLSIPGVLWQQRDKVFSRWKERYFVLTSDYLQCFKKSSPSVMHSAASEMGRFIFKLKLTEVSTREIQQCVHLEGCKYFLTGIRLWLASDFSFGGLYLPFGGVIKQFMLQSLSFRIGLFLSCGTIVEFSHFSLRILIHSKILINSKWDKRNFSQTSSWLKAVFTKFK